MKKLLLTIALCLGVSFSSFANSKDMKADWSAFKKPTPAATPEEYPKKLTNVTYQILQVINGGVLANYYIRGQGNVGGTPFALVGATGTDGEVNPKPVEMFEAGTFEYRSTDGAMHTVKAYALTKEAALARLAK